MRSCVIYTDGACLGNPGPGGWAALIQLNTDSQMISGRDSSTTNNRMEMQAVIAALEFLDESYTIDLYTDSQYVIRGINEWIATWSSNHWLTANRKPVKNKELWQELHAQSLKHRITWHWVRGHSGNQFNELVDRVARDQATKIGTAGDLDTKQNDQ